MSGLSRRRFLKSGVVTSAGILAARRALADDGQSTGNNDVHQQLLDIAAKYEQQRRTLFGAVKSPAELERLQQSLRQKMLRLIGGLPEGDKTKVPAVQKLGQIDADDYVVDKLVYESLPNYFVPALLYRPKNIAAPAPGVLSPCGHSPIGKAEPTYQRLHINLVKRGHVVLTYDPVGQGERSQFWDADKGKSRFNLTCGEHAVLGNPLYLLGGNLARFRIWDGIRGIDYLASIPEVNPKQIACVGNSGGGTLTAYIAALDERVAVAAICCYITTLRRRMATRTQADPDADPEQDVFGFVGEGIDHAGLLALRAPRPTLIGAAVRDFFPIEGARESFAEAKRLYDVAGDENRIHLVEANERHGLSLPLREAVYQWFDRWLAAPGPARPAQEIAVTPRPANELQVCADGQVNLTFQSRPLLRVALDEFNRQPKPAPKSLRELLGLDPNLAAPHIAEIVGGDNRRKFTFVCVNGNQSPDWRDEKHFLETLAQNGNQVLVVDPRGAGKLRPSLAVPGHDYTDPLSGAEENIAYNAFLVGKSLLGMRVSDVLAAIEQIAANKAAQRIVVCGRKDAALVATLAAAVDQRIELVAAEEPLLSFLSLFDPRGVPINAASILPGLLRDFGDISEVLAAIAPRRVLVAAPSGENARPAPSVTVTDKRFTTSPGVLVDWLKG